MKTLMIATLIIGSLFASTAHAKKKKGGSSAVKPCSAAYNIKYDDRRVKKPKPSNPSEQVVENYSQWVADLENTLDAPLACNYESTADFVGVCDPGNTGINGGTFSCGSPENFFKFVCDGTFRKKEQAAASSKYQDLEIEEIIKLIPDEKQRQEAIDTYKSGDYRNQAYFKTGGADTSTFVPLENFLKGPTKDNYLAAKNKLDPNSSLHNDAEAKQSADIDAAVVKKIQNGPYAQKANDLLTQALTQNMPAALDAMQAKLLKSMPTPFPPGSQEFITATFNKMKSVFSKDKIKLDLTSDVCIKDQRNTLVTRGSDGSMKIVICPATLVGGRDAEIMGAIMGALGHAIDSCAMDSMSVSPPQVSLAGLLEPLRACTNDYVNNPTGNDAKGSTTMPPIIKPIVPWADGYPDAARKAAAGFATMNPTAHCNKPLTMAELKNYSATTKMGGTDKDMTEANDKFAQRDQSNDAVAQFFTTKGMADYLSKGSTDKTKKEDQLRQAYAPYCSQRYRLKGAHPRADDILEMVASDPDLLAAMKCDKEANAESAKNKTGADAFLNKTGADAFLNKGSDAFTPDDPATGKSCDAQVAAGFGEYIKNLPSAAKGAKSMVPIQGADGSNSVIGIVPASPPPIGGAGDQGPDNSPPPPVVDKGGPPSDPLKVVPNAKGTYSTEAGESDGGFGSAIWSSDAQLKARSDAVEKAMDMKRDECRSAPFSHAEEIKFIDKACRFKIDGRVDYSPWANSTQVVNANGYSFNIGCQARCSCLFRACGSPEVTYLGENGSKVPPVFNAKNVQYDIDFYTRKDETKGKYSMVAKACLKNPPSPGSDDYVKGCDSGKMDSTARAIIPGKNVTMLGETSGALLEFGCEFHCTCDYPLGDCTVLPSRPAAATVVADPTKKAAPAQIEQAKKGGLDGIIYLANSSMTLDGVQAPAVVPGLVANPTGVDATKVTDDGQGFTFVPANNYTPYDKKVEDRNIALNDATDRAKKECRDKVKAALDAAPPKNPKDPKTKPKTGVEAFCPNGTNTPKDAVFKSSTVTPTATQGKMFNFTCSYDCKNPQNPVTTDYLSEDPPASSYFDLSDPKQREAARAYDWQKLKASANKDCADLGARSTVKGAAKGSKEEKFQIERRLACVSDPSGGPVLENSNPPHLTTYGDGSPMLGEFTGAQLPFDCSISCQCGAADNEGRAPGTPGFHPTCTAAAVPLQLKNASLKTYADVMSKGSKGSPGVGGPPNANPLVVPVPKPPVVGVSDAGSAADAKPALAEGQIPVVYAVDAKNVDAPVLQKMQDSCKQPGDAGLGAASELKKFKDYCSSGGDPTAMSTFAKKAKDPFTPDGSNTTYAFSCTYSCSCPTGPIGESIDWNKACPGKPAVTDIVASTAIDADKADCHCHPSFETPDALAPGACHKPGPNEKPSPKFLPISCSQLKCQGDGTDGSKCTILGGKAMESIKSRMKEGTNCSCNPTSNPDDPGCIKSLADIKDPWVEVDCANLSCGNNKTSPTTMELTGCSLKKGSDDQKSIAAMRPDLEKKAVEKLAKGLCDAEWDNQCPKTYDGDDKPISIKKDLPYVVSNGQKVDGLKINGKWDASCTLDATCSKGGVKKNAVEKPSSAENKSPTDKASYCAGADNFVAKTNAGCAADAKCDKDGFEMFKQYCVKKCDPAKEQRDPDSGICKTKDSAAAAPPTVGVALEDKKPIVYAGVGSSLSDVDQKFKDEKKSADAAIAKNPDLCDPAKSPEYKKALDAATPGYNAKCAGGGKDTKINDVLKVKDTEDGAATLMCPVVTTCAEKDGVVSAKLPPPKAAPKSAIAEDANGCPKIMMDGLAPTDKCKVGKTDAYGGPDGINRNSSSGGGCNYSCFCSGIPQLAGISFGKCDLVKSTPPLSCGDKLDLFGGKCVDKCDGTKTRNATDGNCYCKDGFIADGSGACSPKPAPVKGVQAPDTIYKTSTKFNELVKKAAYFDAVQSKIQESSADRCKKEDMPGRVSDDQLNIACNNRPANTPVTLVTDKTNDVRGDVGGNYTVMCKLKATCVKDGDKVIAKITPATAAPTPVVDGPYDTNAKCKVVDYLGSADECGAPEAKAGTEVKQLQKIKGCPYKCFCDPAGATSAKRARCDFVAIDPVP